MRVIKVFILMVSFFVFFGAVFPIMDGGKDSKAQSQFEKPSVWGNDVIIRYGPTENGISIDHNAGDTLYAASCTTSEDVGNGSVRLFFSADGGDYWYHTMFGVSAGTFSYPMVLTGSVGWKLYLFCLSSYNKGDLIMNRFTQQFTPSGGWSDPKVDGDSITYFTACTDLGLGNYLMIVYQQEDVGDSTPDLYTIRSTDQGVSWSTPVLVSEDGAHPDIAYGTGGCVYLVYESTSGGDREIWFARSNNYCASGSWEYYEALTSDSWDDTYPKIAALHTSPASSPTVWVAYNHDFTGTGNIDLRYAYSTNGGADWSKNHNLATLSDYDEMASHLWVSRSTSSTTVNICYLKHKASLSPFGEWSEIWFRTATSATPTSWTTPVQISDHLAANAQDGRLVCQGTYLGSNCGTLYAGKELFPFGHNFRSLYFDYSAWTDVGHEEQEEKSPVSFSLSPNYPNPFNPETRIEYSISKACQVRLEIFNTLGQKIRILVDEYQSVGKKGVIWDGRNENGNEVASGVYFYRLTAGDFSEAKKMLLLK